MDDRITIRDARDDDADALIALLGGVFAEYPGCVLDVDAEMPELRAIRSHFAERGGRMWVAAHGDRVVGSVGFTPSADGRGLELRKLYVHASARRQGLGGRLCALVEDEARRRGAGFVELWSDTRFLDAHRLYAKRGYERGPETRELHDLSATVEYFFRRAL
jgi:putative acetyltransferase